MTVASYYAWKKFDELAKTTPGGTTVSECPEFPSDQLPAIIKSLSKYEVKVGDIIELKGCWLTDANFNDHAWIMNANGEKGCIWFEDGFTNESVKIRLEYKLCSHYNGLSGLPCDSWFFLDPGDYYIWVHTAFGKSNKVNFRVLAPVDVKKTEAINPEKYVVVGTSSDKSDPYLNVRGGPGTDFPIIRKISDGTAILVIEKYLGLKGDWVKITFPYDTSFIGFVNSKFIELD